MEKLKNAKMIIVLLVALIMICVSTSVSALDILDDPTEGDGVQNAIVMPDYPEDEGEGTPEPSTPSTPTTPTEGEKLPQTGDASDYAIFLLIGLFAVISIYAYRKVKDYNRI